MRIMRIAGTLAVTALVAAGCEDITNPIEEFGEFAPPWVGFDVTSATGPHGSWRAIIFEAPTRPDEDVVVDFAFGGDAVFNQDFLIVEDSGSTTVRTDVTAAGGTTTILADPTREEPQDTMWVFVPEDATVGAELTVEIVSASTADGDPVTVGHIGNFTTFSLEITAAPATIPTGTHTGSVTGDFGSGTIPPVEITDDPVTIGGTQFRYQISDFAYGLFGVAVPWAFNVLSDGSVNFSPSSPAFSSVTADVTGGYDFDTNTLTMNVVLTCCGASGAGWTAVYTLQ